MKSILFIIFYFFSLTAWSWGGRGHHAICEVATSLVETPELKSFLKSKPHMMGHLCNIPDIYWKDLGSEVGKWGNAAHYVDPEIIGVSLQDVPTDYQKIISTYTGKKNAFDNEKTIFSIPTEFGSNWWRADQFMRRIAARKADIQKASLPKNSKEENDDDFPFNKLIFDTIVDMGIMGHFVGDNSQPFHVTADYDGYKAGHGGIHSYYEEAVVSEFDGDLSANILKKARSLRTTADMKKVFQNKSTVEKMKALALISAKDLNLILKQDPILEKSTVKLEKGMQIKVSAKRKPAAVAVSGFQDFIIPEMARSALLLAHLWEEAYEQMGAPKLEAYKNYKYPLQPDFIRPDYFNLGP